MIRTCEAFERWLDEGRSQDAGADTHAHGCARCARSLAAARVIDQALALPPTAAASADFTDEVLRRAIRAREVRRLSPAPALAWWVRVAADPAAALACVLAALFLWRYEALWSFAIGLPARMGTWSDGVFHLLGTIAVLRVLSSPMVILGLAPILMLGSWWLFRWSERFVARRIVPAR